MDDEILLHDRPPTPFRKGPPLPVIENPNPPWRVCPECSVGPGFVPAVGMRFIKGGVHLRGCSRGER